MVILPMTVVFVLDQLTSAGMQEGPVDRAIGLNYELVHQGEWWRVFSASFLNSNPGILGVTGGAHFLGNLLGMTVFGTLALRFLGSAVFWFVLGASSIIPYSLSYILRIETSLRFSGGTSPIVWGVMGVGLVALWVNRTL